MFESELCVINRLDCLNPGNYRILNNLLLPSNGRFATTQIDHVVISKFAIFSIETKSNNGWIFGGTWDKVWKQYYFGKKRQIYNPTFQNYAHVKALRSLIDPYLKGFPIISIVVFPFANEVSIFGPSHAIVLDGLLETIKRFEHEIVAKTNLDYIEQLLLTANITDVDRHERHNSEVQAYVLEKGIEAPFDDSKAVTRRSIRRKTRKKTGRYTGIDTVCEAKGQMNTCVKCKLEYLMEDALKEQWRLWQGHCRSCGENT